MDNYTKSFMADIHKLDEKSEYYFQPYKSNDRTKEWVDSRYPSSGLQAINTQTFANLFIHAKGSNLWGWEENYVDILKKKLDGNLLPVFELAVWFFKYEEWQSDVTLDDILEKFSLFFNITENERKELFLSLDLNNLTKTDFQDDPVAWDQLSKFISLPPDADPPHEVQLAFIETKQIGPIEHLIMEASDRLNLITGDNGLGKTFLMECCWWVLTGSWSSNIIIPNSISEYKTPLINFTTKGDKGGPLSGYATFDIEKLSWQRNKNMQIPGLCIYVRADGSYAIWDPLKQRQSIQNIKRILFSTENIWDGINGCIEGLVRDWVNWQRINGDEYKCLQNVLMKLSPPDLGDLKPGKIDRFPNDSRDIPTIKHRYGNIPVTQASAGVKRILTLSYLIVWAWNEHKIQARLQNTVQENKMVILIDEIEEHLHPKWQRVILPSLLSVPSVLSKKMSIQFIISTHSPMVLASLENHFDFDIDRLFKIDLEEETNRVSMAEIDFIKYGQINSWLTSPIFNLGMARSNEAEETINEAIKLQSQNNPNQKEVQAIHHKLLQVLSQEDPFWPRWIFLADKMGIKI